MSNERRRREDGARGGSGWSSSGIGLSVVVHLLAVALIFFAPHRLPAPPPTAYTVEIIDPSAVGGKLLAGPIGGADAKALPPAKVAPPPAPAPPEPEPEPEAEPEQPAEEPPPEQMAKVEEPPPPELEEEDDPDAVPLGTPRATAVATATRRVVATPRPTKLPTARPTARPTQRPSPRATAAATVKPKATATPAVVIAKKSLPSPVTATRRPESVRATPDGEQRPKTAPGSETRPKTAPTSGTSDDLDGQLAEAIKGVEAKVEKQAGSGGVGGEPKPGAGMGGTDQTLDGPAGIGGSGPGGGGTLRGLDFAVYYNQMLNRIKDRWTWAGVRSDLRVTVRFSILPSGEITNIRLERSGDQGYDGSVERAVKAAGPLPPPPAAYRADFEDVELTFRPADLKR